VLAEFTGNKESVIKVHTPDALARLIRFVAVTSSQIGSGFIDAGAASGDVTKQDILNKQVQDFSSGELQDANVDDWD
jgi:hypothetical protein